MPSLVFLLPAPFFIVSETPELAQSLAMEKGARDTLDKLSNQYKVLSICCLFLMIAGARRIQAC